jgi:hypothetical protein
MKDFSRPRTFILSAYKGVDADTDARQHSELACDLALDGIPFAECTGTFNGFLEAGFIIVGAESQNYVAQLATEYGQETYLVIAEHDRTAYLVDTTTGYHTHLGRFISLGDTPPIAGDWTLVNDTYYTTDDRPGVDLPEGF